MKWERVDYSVDIFRNHFFMFVDTINDYIYFLFTPATKEDIVKNYPKFKDLNDEELDNAVNVIKSSNDYINYYCLDIYSLKENSPYKSIYTYVHSYEFKDNPRNQSYLKGLSSTRSKNINDIKSFLTKWIKNNIEEI